MLSTDSWLRIICSMQINAILFGLGAVTVLANPVLAANAKIWLPLVIALSLALSPFIAAKIAPRLRLSHWRDVGRRGDFISG